MLATLNFHLGMVFTTLYGAGLTELWSGIRKNWIAPIFFAMIAIGAFVFLKNQQITKLILFLVVAALVGVLIFGSDVLFGENGPLKNMFQETAKQVGSDNAGGMAGN